MLNGLLQDSTMIQLFGLLLLSLLTIGACELSEKIEQIGDGEK